MAVCFPDRSSQQHGHAELEGFPKFVANGRMRSFRLVISQMPEKTSCVHATHTTHASFGLFDATLCR